VCSSDLEADQSLLYGSNFSIGVNLFFHVNKLLAKAIAPYQQYDVQVEEIHHIQKLDAPSGTAITIAEGIIDNNEIKKTWVNQVVGAEEEIVNQPHELLIESLRIEEVPRSEEHTSELQSRENL